MSVILLNFTQSALNKIKAPTKEEKIIQFRDTKERNLLLIISYTGFRRFYLVINIGGRYYKIKIGTSPDLTVKEARKKVMKLKKDIANGINPMDERRKINKERREKRNKRLGLQTELTFGQVHGKYAEYSRIYHPKSWKKTYLTVKSYTVPFYHKDISKVTVEDIQKLFDEKTEKKYYVTANDILTKLNPIFNKAIEWGLIDKNPVHGIKRHRQESRSRYVTNEEMRRLMAVLKEKENSQLTESQKRAERSGKIFTFISLFTAARKSNVLGMRWDEISLSEKIWCIPKTNSKSGKTLYIGLADALITILKYLKQETNSEWVLPSPKDNSKHWSNMAIQYAWDKIRKKARIPDVTIHDLRRTFATWSINNGEELRTIAEILGHSRISTTAEIYTKISLEKVKAATNKVVNNILTGDNANTELDKIIPEILASLGRKEEKQIINSLSEK
ncbi:tyrosine-type recombinase/integrase [Orientia tsutsugamushi]|uniref:tyrosine-type recombinase/integrase n=1 Tax=Orientia tsutsugamushi TaxID=784 RepID=UPI003529ACF4